MRTLLHPKCQRRFGRTARIGRRAPSQAPAGGVWLMGIAVWCVLALGCSPNSRETVVVYTSQDQVYAEPILNAFQRETGIEVKAVYDSEAVKTVGLANRLLAERQNPQCDVFWSNEELRTHQLALKGVFRESEPWLRFGFRTRRIVYNTNHVSAASAPRSFQELTNSAWQGKLALAYPLFGTTVTHFVALRRAWGHASWEAWCQSLVANRPLLVDGNSVVVNLVGRGEAWVGMTDWDDIAAGQRQGLPVASAPLAEDSLVIPNTAAIIQGCRHPAAAQRLVEYLNSPEVGQRLVEAHALEGASITSVSTVTLQPAWEALVLELDAATQRLKEIFLR